MKGNVLAVLLAVVVPTQEGERVVDRHAAERRADGHGRRPNGRDPLVLPAAKPGGVVVERRIEAQRPGVIVHPVHGDDRFLVLVDSQLRMLDQRNARHAVGVGRLGERPHAVHEPSVGPPAPRIPINDHHEVGARVPITYPLLARRAVFRQRNRAAAGELGTVMLAAQRAISERRLPVGCTERLQHLHRVVAVVVGFDVQRPRAARLRQLLQPPKVRPQVLPAVASQAHEHHRRVLQERLARLGQPHEVGGERLHWVDQVLREFHLRTATATP